MIKTQKEYEELVAKLIEHDKHYYEECKPLISDYEYDLLIKELEAYEKEHVPSPLSPTQRIKEGFAKGFKQEAHSTPMLSLANTYSEEEVEEYINRVYKLLDHPKELLFCVELKMDGTAISVKYEQGVFSKAITRGDGKTGDDVTYNIKTIRMLPLRINYEEILDIRGEVFMHKKVFQYLNAKREEEGLEPFANPRNAAAGTLKLLDSREVAKRRLDIVFYGFAENRAPVSSQFEVHKYLKNLKLPVSASNHFAICKNLKEIMDFAEKIKKERDLLPFEIDGIVIKVDNLSLHGKLGTTGKTPRYAIAYKFAPEQASTRIKAITVQVGRTGVLTPVAELEPIHLAGSTISRATLHNQDEIKRKDIRVGDIAIIEKGGDVIPKVVHIDVNKRETGSKEWHMPSKCPICHTEVIRRKDEVAIRCPNPLCKGRRLRHIIFFASKAAMDIEHMGEGIVERLFNENLISRVSDIYLLKSSLLETLEGFKEKSINNLLESIEKSKKCSLGRFILALEIPHVGAQTADLLADFAENIQSLLDVKKEALIAIEGIGEKTAEAICNYFADPFNKEEITLLLKYGVSPQKQQKKFKEHPFQNKTFVLTGTLKNYTRNEAIALIKERGGKVASSVSKQTDFILAGSDPGSKYDKAKKLQTPILTEEEFQKKL